FFFSFFFFFFFFFFFPTKAGIPFFCLFLGLGNFFKGQVVLIVTVMVVTVVVVGRDGAVAGRCVGHQALTSGGRVAG
ncbi:hypothetical protein PYK79_50845, partial [Streptomyces sp. ID05-04B]|nr:hypothetical protein [Streptomyces sp. ID05-04B]